jgi:hypothetical protein
VLRNIWAEDGLSVFTRSFGPAAAHEVLLSVVFSLYDASAPVRSLAQSYQFRYVLLAQPFLDVCIVRSLGAIPNFTARHTSSNKFVNGSLQSLSLAADECLRALLIAVVTRPLQTVVRRLDIQGSGLEVLPTALAALVLHVPSAHANMPRPSSYGTCPTQGHWIVSQGYGAKRAYRASTR